MKFFSKEFMTDEHLKALIESRKKYVRNKIVRHNGNYLEVVNMEKGLRVLPKPEEDELLKEILEIERFDEIIHVLKTGEYKNYHYEKLSKRLRNYMQSLDALLLGGWIRKVKYSPSEEEYNRKEERLEKLIPNYTEEDYLNHVILGKPIPTTLGKKAKESGRRAYKTVKEILMSNVGRFKYFVTLTFAPEEQKEKHLEMNASRKGEEYDLEFSYVNAKDFEMAKGVYTKAIEVMRKTLRRKGKELDFITVWELQKNGNYHFHMLCSELPEEFLYKMPEWLDYDFRKQRMNEGYGLKYWKYGKSDVQEIKSPERLTTYVSKYILKSFMNVSEESYEEYLGKKKYFTSKGMERAEGSYTVTDEEVEKILSEMELENEVAFVTQYINPYNEGKIEKRLYTLI